MALIMLLSLAISRAQTQTSFDKFKNRTHFTAKSTEAGPVTFDGESASLLIRRMEIIVGFMCEGQVDSCLPKQAELLFVGHTSDWVMKGNSVVNLLIDGKPETIGRTDWDGQVLEADDLVEYNDISIAPELLTRLAEAKTVDVQIGLFEFSLTDANFAAIRDVAGHAGWMPDGLKKTLLANMNSSESSPAAAAQLAEDGRVRSLEELPQLLQEGRASKTAIITTPAGAEVYLDGNKVGITPIAFVLLKRDNPRVLAIKLAGYKAIEKTLVPDGKSIPISITLEKVP